MSDKPREFLRAAVHALRSYQYGNSSPDLAESIANTIDAYLSAPAQREAEQKAAMQGNAAPSGADSTEPACAAPQSAGERDRILSMMHEAASMYPGCRVPINAMIERARYLFASPAIPQGDDKQEGK